MPPDLSFQVESAVKFLLNPKVGQSPMKQKRMFLRSKGLTDAEIDEACLQAGVPKDDQVPLVTSHPVTPFPPPPYPVVVHGPSWVQTVRDFLHFVALITGAAYGCYYLWKVEQKGPSLALLVQCTLFIQMFRV